mmetsp:Transcript_39412/g.75530  ORF Transcript_39412/g.75530 Transcript_39412/m.75530 type:complete len:235 (-) Transcript_39412:26-730(-)
MQTLQQCGHSRLKCWWIFCMQAWCPCPGLSLKEGHGSGREFRLGGWTLSQAVCMSVRGSITRQHITHFLVSLLRRHRQRSAATSIYNIKRLALVHAREHPCDAQVSAQSRQMQRSGSCSAIGGCHMLPGIASAMKQLLQNVQVSSLQSLVQESAMGVVANTQRRARIQQLPKNVHVPCSDRGQAGRRPGPVHFVHQSEGVSQQARHRLRVAARSSFHQRRAPVLLLRVVVRAGV